MLLLALGAGVVGAAAEYPLARRFPLERPLPIGYRMAAAGALVATSVLVVGLLARGRRGDR